ncbi:hypothetical protein DPMN_147390 [Dreissena polymorpha]|uniref:NXPE C-terminal domain-containing protein n=2 Tax=Dreissena polymorpha TaxID=45954 RepID=A0A9D4J3B7_DREPO|nr:hypothetical protein DPMN_147390 [Dreissena polymorpha]
MMIVLAQQIKGDGKLASHMHDHDNGTYSVRIRIPWAGTTVIRVKNAAKIENTCLRLRTMDTYGTSVFSMKNVWGIGGKFLYKNETDFTVCLPSEMMVNHTRVCNYTSINDGLPWFCAHPRPKELSCEHIQSFNAGSFDGVVKANNPLKVYVPSVEHINAVANIEAPANTHDLYIEKPLCKQMQKGLTWENITNNINGFWMNNTWSLLNCKSYIEHQNNTYRSCLKGKYMYFFGDSTARQYAEFFVNVVLETRPGINLRRFGENNTYHWRKTFSSFDINVTYLKHAMPFTNPVVPFRGITSVYSELQILSKSSITGDKLIFVFAFHAHFQSFPISVFRDRTRRLVSSIKEFLTLKPKALFFVKGPNYCFDDTHWFDNTLTLVYIEILQQEFESLHDRVVYLDTWSLNVIHETRNIHPGPVTLQNQIRHFMAYVC